MALFEKSFQAANALETNMTVARDTFVSAKKEILNTFKSPMAENKLAEAKAIFENVEIEQKANAKAAVAEDFEAARQKVIEMTTAASPADFMDTLEVIRAKGENISDFEVRAYLRKYEDNYAAFSTLCDMLHQSGKVTNVLAVKPDFIDNEITELERMVMNWIQTFKIGTYTGALLTDQNQSLFWKLAATVQAFLDGGFCVGDSTSVGLAEILNKANEEK